MGEVKVFCSGCYDVLHAGHLEFFTQARALGDYLCVCIAGEKALRKHKQRASSIPIDHKLRLMRALRMVDEVCVGEDEDVLGLNFVTHFMRVRPALLVVTEDDKYGDVKRELCAKVGAKYVVLPKDLDIDKTSTTEILQRIRAPQHSCLRVDFAGGWLDMPCQARQGAYVVNCAISPTVSLHDWPYAIGGGLGGSAAWALLQGRDSTQSELDLGVGWQDPAAIKETGLCVWRSGPRPVLDFKSGGEFLRGRMALLWTGKPHVTPELAALPRDYDMIEAAGKAARAAVLPGSESIVALGAAVGTSYAMQLKEGMQPLPDHGQLGAKYCGGGWGGYAVYLFETQQQRDAFCKLPDTTPIEPYIRQQ